MERATLDTLETVLQSVTVDLVDRVETLASKSTSGTLTDSERQEYEEIVQLNNVLSLARLQALQFWLPRIN